VESGNSRPKTARACALLDPLVALGYTILVIVYHILTRQEPYRDLGATYFDLRDQQRVEHRLVHRLERLGYVVNLQRAA
jgi:transposase